MTTVLALVLVAQLAPDHVQSAIADGTKSRQSMAVLLEKGPMAVYLTGPYARIATAAARSAQKYLPFSPDDVTPDMAAWELEVRIVPANPEPGSIHRNPTHVVIKAGGRVLQPLRLDAVPLEWANAVGGTWTGQSLIGRFDWSALPAGDLTIVVITPGREYAVTLKAKDRALVR